MHVETKNQVPLSNILVTIIHDKTDKLERNLRFPFPHDAEAEWETQQTIDKV